MIGHLNVHLRRQLRRLVPGKTTTLDDIIPGEILNDKFYRAIQRHASSAQIGAILEIGSSAGEGSTRAFVTGIQQNPARPRLYCMEVSEARFDALRQAYATYDFVRPFNVSSVPLKAFASADEVTKFYQTHITSLNKYPLETVLSWLEADIKYIAEHSKDLAGIQHILKSEQLNGFDLVLIDGSEFTAKAELMEVIGAKVIMLDDINGFKNYDNYAFLKTASSYRLDDEDWSLRNGYAIFVKTDAACDSKAAGIES
jgi:hypothetical protein